MPCFKCHSLGNLRVGLVFFSSFDLRRSFNGYTKFLEALNIVKIYGKSICFVENYDAKVEEGTKDNIRQR